MTNHVIYYEDYSVIPALCLTCAVGGQEVLTDDGAVLLRALAVFQAAPALFLVLLSSGGSGRLPACKLPGTFPSLSHDGCSAPGAAAVDADASAACASHFASNFPIVAACQPTRTQARLDDISMHNFCQILALQATRPAVVQRCNKVNTWQYLQRVKEGRTNVAGDEQKSHGSSIAASQRPLHSPKCCSRALRLQHALSAKAATAAALPLRSPLSIFPTCKLCYH